MGRSKLRRYGGLRDADGDGDPHRFGVDTIVVEKIFSVIDARRYGREEGAHQLLGIVEEIGGGFLGAGNSVASAQFAQALCSRLAGGDLRAEVAFALFGRADVV